MCVAIEVGGQYVQVAALCTGGDPGTIEAGGGEADLTGHEQTIPCHTYGACTLALSIARARLHPLNGPQAIVPRHHELAEVAGVRDGDGIEDHGCSSAGSRHEYIPGGGDIKAA